MGTSTQGPEWRRSRRCGSTTCAEVAIDSRAVHLRDAKNPSGPSLTFSHHAWRALLVDIRNGHLNAPPAGH